MKEGSVNYILSEQQRASLEPIKQRYHNGETVVIYLKSKSHMDASIIAGEIQKYCDMKSALFCFNFMYADDDFINGLITCQITATKPHTNIGILHLGHVKVEVK